jgi:AraC-like DNA-binding protein
VTAEPIEHQAAAPTVFETDEPLLVHAYIGKTYAPTAMRQVGDQSRLWMRDEQFHCGPLRLADFTHTAGLELRAEPFGRLLIARVWNGRWRCDTVGEPDRWCRSGDVVLVAQPDRPTNLYWDDPVHLQFVSIDPTILLDVAAADGDLVPRFTSLTLASLSERKLLGTVLDYVTQEVAEGGIVVRYPSMLNGVARTLAAALLECFPNTAARDPVVRDRIDATRSHVLRRAVAYLHDHAHEDVSVRLLAENAQATRQAVHLAFRHQLQTTPRMYLERIRLDRAHRDLTDLDVSTTTVAEVARRWGFGRLERFRTDYTRRFGCSPAQTLNAP